MIKRYAATYTGCDDLFLVYTRDGQEPTMMQSVVRTQPEADALAARLNLRDLVDTLQDVIDNGDLTDDNTLVAAMAAADELASIFHWDLDGYLALRRIEDAKNLAAGIVELEATA